jgi:aminoglycoside 6-adenylyltransferase
MRSEREMLDLILDTARCDERIRAVILNGSRANPNAPRDPFQDYDVVYLVTDVDSFRTDPGWIKRFGKLLILQMPDDMLGEPPRADGGHCWLMQFTDGTRIDLSVVPVASAAEACRDSLTKVLLDKDGIVPPLQPPDERDYLPKPPSAREFAECCNEFWWVCPYVAKGLWRDELPYARYMLDQVVRDQLVKMLAWFVGMRTGFEKGPGKFGKCLKRYLQPELWTLFEKTYADARIDSTWEALSAMCDLFRKTALQVASHLGFEYPAGDDGRVSAHLAHVRTLPPDATKIY